MNETFFKPELLAVPPWEHLALYTSPSLQIQQEAQTYKNRVKQEMPHKIRLGLTIIRMQPLHYGHIYLMDIASEVSDALVVGIGSANVRDTGDNPYSATDREKMLMRSLDSSILNQIVGIVHLNDYPNDDFWLQETLRKTGEVDAVFGNNEWVNGIFRNNNIPAIEVPKLERDTLYRGEIVRKDLRDKGLL